MDRWIDGWMIDGWMDRSNPTETFPLQKVFNFRLSAKNKIIIFRRQKNNNKKKKQEMCFADKINEFSFRLPSQLCYSSLCDRESTDRNSSGSDGIRPAGECLEHGMLPDFVKITLSSIL